MLDKPLPHPCKFENADPFQRQLDLLTAFTLSLLYRGFR
jgi:hypothetical protein